MFVPGHWAAAFINSLAAQGGEAAQGLSALEALASWVRALPGAVFGSSAADRLEKLLREGVEKTGGPALEIAIRFLVLMVRKNVIHRIDSVIDETKKILDRKNGTVQVSVEYAFPPEGNFESRLKEIFLKRMGAARVEITGQVNTELIGGYRLRIGDEIIDASIRCQLRKLETCLAAGSRYGGN